MKKTAFITGGSSGLGFELAVKLGEQGYRIIINGRNTGRLGKAVELLQSRGIEAEGQAGDISKTDEMEKVKKSIEKSHGSLDYLILNAGVVTVNKLTDIPSFDELKKDIDIDLWGTILTAYLFVPMLNDESRVLMISSGFGVMGAAGYSTYCAAKAGIINFAESLRRELLHRNIAVQVAIPGDMDTPQFHEEINSQPEWMKSDAPRGMIKPEIAAEKILRKCRNRKGHPFFVIINFEVFLLAVMLRLLPRRFRDFMLDSMFPIPQK